MAAVAGERLEQPVKPSPEGVPGAVTDPSLVRAYWIGLEGHGGFQLRAYLAQPTAAGPHPGLVLVHHAPGVDDHIQDVANRFAAQGFTVISPELFGREGGPPDITNLQELIDRLSGLPDAQVIGDLEAAARFLAGLPEHNGKTGCIGFCMGGRYTLLFACTTNLLAAAVDCWGGFVDRARPDAVSTPNRPQPPLELVPRLSCPLYAAFGEEDDNPSVAVARRLEELAAGVPYETVVRVFPGAGHAFFNDRRPSYRPEAAHALWRDVLPFLQRHLGV
jgi:carboxymethylenebutenolidase